MVTLVMCGTWLYRFLIVAVFLTFLASSLSVYDFSTLYTWVKVFKNNPKFRILRLTFHRKSASKC